MRGGCRVRAVVGYGASSGAGSAEGAVAIATSLLLASVVQAPGDGIEEADETCLADASAEQRVGGEGAESIVADLGVRRGRAAVDESKIVVGGEDRSVKKDDPDVDTQRRLFNGALG